MNLLQRVPNNALVGMAAIAVLGETRRQKNGAVNEPDHLERRNQPRIACQFVAAVGPMLGSQEAVLRQLLKDLREQRLRDSVQVGNYLRTRAFGPMHHQVLESD